jgi:hypothetical protein
VLGWRMLQGGEESPARVGYPPLARLAHIQLLAEDVDVTARAGPPCASSAPSIPAPLVMSTAR